MNLREESLVHLAHMIDDLVDLASGLDCDSDEMIYLQNEVDKTVITLWETAT